jgi:hypothetical protein
LACAQEITLMTFTARPSRTLAGICAAAAVSMAAVPGAQAEDGFGYTDVRLTIGTMPWDGYSGGPAYNQGSDDFDSAYRISVMAVGPICGILPIGCETPARLSYESSSGSDDDYGTTMTWAWSPTTRPTRTPAAMMCSSASS